MRTKAWWYKLGRSSFEKESEKKNGKMFGGSLWVAKNFTVFWDPKKGKKNGIKWLKMAKCQNFTILKKGGLAKDQTFSDPFPLISQLSRCTWYTSIPLPGVERL